MNFNVDNLQVELLNLGGAMKWSATRSHQQAKARVAASTIAYGQNPQAFCSMARSLVSHHGARQLIAERRTAVSLTEHVHSDFLAPTGELVGGSMSRVFSEDRRFKAVLRVQGQLSSADRLPDTGACRQTLVPQPSQHP
ncbi:hypothetical protein [Rhizobium sp. SGZ-381]|uniref:hypothetical protein n=1 Tax=Rhizobium sp. SGZ-381 TaxID=3342800 RepID=UPI00366F2921